MFGVVYKILRDGTGYQLLHDFSDVPDGANPSSGLCLGPDGFLYGATAGGNGYGTISRVSPNGGVFQVIYRFDATNSYLPSGNLTQGSDGALYGTTVSGPLGSVFKVRTDGLGFQALHGLTGSPDGAMNTAANGVIQGWGGLLLGATTGGGAANAGTIFRIDTNGNGYQTVWSFTNQLEGKTPRRVIQGTDGVLYGVTASGGIGNVGTLFRINTDGNEYQILHNFANGPDGSFPGAGLVQAWDGALYGTTLQGGRRGRWNDLPNLPGGSGYAVVYSFSNTLARPSLTSPRAGLTVGSSSFGNSGCFTAWDQTADRATKAVFLPSSSSPASLSLH